MKKLPLFILFALVFIQVSAQMVTGKEMERKLDSLVSAEITPGEPGMAILVVQKGNLFYKKAFGSANLELGIALQPDMVFRIGSITKQFTAIAILQLVEQGRLLLQDSIQKYVKGFPFKGYTITIEHLLTHTSGLKEYTVIDHPDPYIDRHELTPAFIVDHFKNTPLEFESGTKYAYSNSGYVLLGLVIEALSGKSYYDYLRENVIAKAGLMNTYIDNMNTIIPKRVAGYTRDRGFFENTYYQSPSLGYAAGVLLSTVEDLYNWNKALLDYKLVKKETLDKAFTPYTLKNGTRITYGYGWFIDSMYDRKCIHHEGQVSGFIAAERYFPNEDIFVSILSNVKSGEDKTDFSDRRFRLFDRIGRIGVGQALPKSEMVNEKILEGYTGTYQLTTNTSRTITIVKEKGVLLAKVSGQATWPMSFRSDTKFAFEDIPDAAGEFVIENGKVTKIIISQGGIFEWRKIK